MPNFHFHLHNAPVEASDTEDTEAPHLAAARLVAIDGIRDFLSHEVKQGRMDLRGQVDIAEPDGHILLTVSFVDAVQILYSAQ